MCKLHVSGYYQSRDGREGWAEFTIPSPAPRSVSDLGAIRKLCAENQGLSSFIIIGWHELTDDHVSDWQLIEIAPHDGTEILVRDEEGHRAIVAFLGKGSPANDGWVKAEDDGWFRRADGEFDLYDAFALREVYPVEWMLLP